MFIRHQIGHQIVYTNIGDEKTRKCPKNFDGDHSSAFFHFTIPTLLQIDIASLLILLKQLLTFRLEFCLFRRL